MEDIGLYYIQKRSHEMGLGSHYDFSFEKVLFFCDLGAYLD